MKYDLAVSIVIYHPNKELLLKAINSVLKSSLSISIYIVDNSETNEISELLDTKNLNINYVFNNENIGFGKAHNMIMQKTIDEGIPYHIILNPDAWFGNNVIEELYAYIEKHKDVGNISPKVYYENGEVQYLCKLAPTPFDLIFRRFFPDGKWKKRSEERYELKFTGYDKIMEIPILSGCFMLLRTETLKKVGLFDERYFMYMEDVDFSRRINRHSKTIFYPDVHIYHAYAKGSYSNPKLLKYHIRSAIRYFNKWGWLFDKERSLMNRKILSSFNK